MKPLFFYTFALFFFTTFRLFASEKKPEERFPQGSVVQIFNRENPETLGNLNGAIGVVQRFNVDSGEYTLVYTAGYPFSAKHEDLQLLGDMENLQPEKVFAATIDYLEFLLQQYKDSIQDKRYDRSSSQPITRDTPVTVYYIPVVPSSRLVNGFHPQIEGMNNLLVRVYETVYRRQDTVNSINYESFFSQISAYHHLKKILDQKEKTAFFSGYFYYDDKKPEDFSLKAHKEAQGREAFLIENAHTLSLCKKTQKEDGLRKLLRDPKYFDLAQGLLDPYLGGFHHLFRHDGYDLSTFQKTTPMLEINLLKLSLLMEKIIAPILHPSFANEENSMVSKETSQQLFLKFLQKIKTDPWPEALRERAQALGDISQPLDEKMIKDFVQKACKDIILFWYEQTMLTTFSNINNYVAKNPEVENIVLSFGVLQDFEEAAQDEDFGLAFPYVEKYLPTMDESTLEEKTKIWLELCPHSSAYGSSMRSFLDSLTLDFFIKRKSGDRDESKASPLGEPVAL